MKKFKTLLFSSVPLWLTMAVQLVVIYYMLFLAMFFLYSNNPALTFDTTGAMDALYELLFNVQFQAVISIVFSICCILLFGMWYYSRCGGEFRIQVKKDIHPLEILGIAILIPGTQFLSNIITSIVSIIFPSWLEAYEEMVEAAGLTGDIPLLMLIYSVLLAPISEELIFRGVIFRIAKRAFPFWIANIIQAFLFGVFHQNMIQGCYTFVLGLFLGYICEKSSIYHVFIFHFLFNLWGTHATEIFANIDETLFGFIVLFGSVICTIAGTRLFNKGNLEKRMRAQNSI